MSPKIGSDFGVCWRNWIAHLTTVDVHLCKLMLSSGGSRFESWVDRDNTRLRPQSFSSVLRELIEHIQEKDALQRVFYSIHI